LYNKIAPEDKEALVTIRGIVVPAGRIQSVAVNSELLASLRPVIVAEPDTTVKQANEPVTEVVVTTPVAFAGIFAILFFSC
jgi:hypothetical protein